MGNFFSQNEPVVMRNIRNQKNYEFYFTNQRFFVSPYINNNLEYCIVDNHFNKK